MVQVTQAAWQPGDHADAVALAEVAERVTGAPWHELGVAGAERVVDLLAETLHRMISRSA